MPFVRSHDLDIYYEVHGPIDAERDLVFAHGMGGNAASWFNQIAAFADRARVVAFDHRYFGRSGCQPEQFRPALFVDDALAIMNAEGVERAGFVCQSMGGWTGSQMALQHPDRVTALVMSHTPGVFEHPDVANDTTQAAELINAALGGNRSPAVSYHYLERDPAGAVLYQQLSAFNAIDTGEVTRRIGQAGLGVDISALESYNVPTLFVTGDEDVLFQASFIEGLAARLPSARFANLGAVGHSSYFETPERFNDIVGEFLEDVDALAR